jgi:tetratricopeptide (TPR) repeat protein
MAVKCQQCGDSYESDKLINGEICPTCDKPYQIKNYRTVAAMTPPQVNKYITAIQTQLTENPGDRQLNASLGICFLKLKLPEKALPFFEKAMEDNFAGPGPYFYAAICLLRGKKAFLAMRPEIDLIEKYLDAAISLEPGGIFYYFRAYIKYDYYSRKFFKTSPTWQEALTDAKNAGVTADDITDFYSPWGLIPKSPLTLFAGEALRRLELATPTKKW